MATKKSWAQIVKDKDPEYKERQDEYIFSNNRKFKEKKNPYGN